MKTRILFSNLRRLCKYAMKMYMHGVGSRHVCTDPTLGRNLSEYLDCDEFNCPYCEIEDDKDRSD